MNKVYLLLLFVLVLISCDKNEMSDLDYPVTYQEKQAISTSPVRMFSKAGEIKDAALIQKYVTLVNTPRFLSSTAWYFPNATTQEITKPLSYKLLSSKSAEVFDDIGILANYDLSYSKGLLTFTDKKEGVINVRPATDDEYFRLLRIAVSRHKPMMYNKQVLPSGSGPGFYYLTRNQRYATLGNNMLRIHRMNYSIITSKYEFSTYGVYNEFDDNAFTALNANDTLLVQQFEIHVLKQ